MILPIHYPSAHHTTRKKAREQYVVEQENKCAHCGNDLSGDPTRRILNAKINRALFPKGMFNHPIHLHHCHTSGMTIGAIHARCNAYLWQYFGE